MDSITKSLREYLDSVKISHTTLYNTDSGNKIGYPTSTCFICGSENYIEREMSIVVDIYPEDQMFFLSAHPQIIFEDKNIDLMHALETKWNRSGFMTSLIIEEERGVIMPDTYCLKLSVCGYSGGSGFEESIWKRYIEKTKQEYSYIEECIKGISDEDAF